MIEIPVLEPVPYGYCECRCGQKTWIATCSYWKYGWVKGQPVKFMEGHHRRVRPIPEDAVPFKINNHYCRLIPLTQNQWAIVWESRYLEVMQFKWYVVKRDGVFYAYRGIFHPDGRRGVQGMHEFLFSPPPVGKTIDHTNGVSLDNRQDNFRYATPEEQVRNRKKSKSSRNIYKGYKRQGRRFYARIRFGGKEIGLGVWDTEEEAARAYDRGALLYFGEFARLNFPLGVNSPHEAAS